MIGANENHCGRLNCRCTHTEGCERGFVHIRYLDEEIKTRKGEKIVVERWYDGVQFCSVCNAERAHIQQTSMSTQEIGQRLRGLSSYKNTENYEKQEAGKTRTL